MPHAIGFFDKDGSPTLKIKVGGVFQTPTEFVAIIDTGFTGFLSMPLIAAFPLGLPLTGTTSVVLADGQDQSKLIAQCKVTIDDTTEPKLGLVILEPSSTDILVGMEFLRAFQFGLFVSAGGIMLFDDKTIIKAAKDAKAAEEAQESVAQEAKSDAAKPQPKKRKPPTPSPSTSSIEQPLPSDQLPSSDRQ